MAVIARLRAENIAAIHANTPRKSARLWPLRGAAACDAGFDAVFMVPLLAARGTHNIDLYQMRIRNVDDAARVSLTSLNVISRARAKVLAT